MDPTQQAVTALVALDDGELAAAVAAAAGGRPGLDALRTAALAAAAGAYGRAPAPPPVTPPAPPPATPPAPPPVGPAGPPPSAVPSVPDPEVAEGELVEDVPPPRALGAAGVPAHPVDEATADPFGARVGAAAGAAELDAGSPAGRAAAAAHDERHRAGRERLEEIRRSMGGAPG